MKTKKPKANRGEAADVQRYDGNGSEGLDARIHPALDLYRQRGEWDGFDIWIARQCLELACYEWSAEIADSVKRKITHNRGSFTRIPIVKDPGHSYGQCAACHQGNFDLFDGLCRACRRVAREKACIDDGLLHDRIGPTSGKLLSASKIETKALRLGKLKSKPLPKPTYRDFVEWIAMNDGDGDNDALDIEHVSSLISTTMVAHLFGYNMNKVGRDVVNMRRQIELGTKDE